MINSEAFKHMTDLPDHAELCRELLMFFHADKDIDAAFIAGSGASGGMDFHSDLDLGFVCSSQESKEKIWRQRLDWALPPWFHRMDADHIKSYFIIYLCEPHIHVDLAFYTMDDLPSQAGAPFVTAFDKKARLGPWLAKVNAPANMAPDWSNVVHEEERFWTWIHYCWGHVGRGEYYDIASSLNLLRGLVESWHVRLKGIRDFSARRLEQRGEQEFVEVMRPVFPRPDRASLKAALLSLIALHTRQRAEVERLLRPSWTTKPPAREKITKLVQEL